MSQRTAIVMPAYNAAETLAGTIARLPDGCYDDIIVVDDCSTDNTTEVAEQLGVHVVRHEKNRGYGGNQKTCYATALERGADFVVMLHPDGQYDPLVVPAAVDMLRYGILDVVLGNRIRTRREALSGKMPIIKYLANRGLTFIENVLTGQNLGEWHSGFRAYNRAVLETLPIEHNSEDFVFDSQFLIQSVHFGFRVGDIPIPVKYFDEASSISFGRASRYAIETMLTFVRWFGHRLHLGRSKLFLPKEKPATAGPSASDAKSI